MKCTKRDAVNRVLAHLIVYGGGTLVLFGVLFGFIALAEALCKLPLSLALAIVGPIAGAALWYLFKNNRKEK